MILRKRVKGLCKYVIMIIQYTIYTAIFILAALIIVIQEQDDDDDDRDGGILQPAYSKQ